MDGYTKTQVRVAKGAALLDVEQPGWYKEIDLGLLDLKDSCRCVLGQLYDDRAREEGSHLTWTMPNGYDTGRKALKMGSFDDCIEYGFTLHADCTWAQLDELWIAEIKARKDADKNHQWCVDCEEHLPVAEFDSPEDDLCIDCRQDAFADAHMSMEIGAAV